MNYFQALRPNALRWTVPVENFSSVMSIYAGHFLDMLFTAMGWPVNVSALVVNQFDTVTIKEQLAFGGQGDAAGAAVKQPHPQALFHPRHALTDRRGGNFHQTAGFGKAACFSDLHKGHDATETASMKAPGGVNDNVAPFYAGGLGGTSLLFGLWLIVRLAGVSDLEDVPAGKPCCYGFR